MKNLLKYFVFIFFILETSFVFADINSKEDLKKHLIANGLSFFQPNGTIRSMTFSPNGKAEYNNQEVNTKQEWIWEIIDSKSFKAGHPKIVEQKGWVIFKINFDRNEIVVDTKQINGQMTTVKIKNSKYSNEDSSLTYLSENDKNFPWCIGWIAEKIRVEGQHKVTYENRKLMQKPITKKITDILRSYMDATGGDWKKINNTFDSNLMYEYQNGRGAHIVFHRNYTGSTLEAKKAIAEMKCIVID